MGNHDSGNVQDALTRLAQQVRTVLDKHGIGKGQPVEQAIDLLDIELERLREIQQRSGELAAQAADGRQYRQDLIAEALAEGVRAYGQEFDKATYEGMLKDAPLTVIKRMRDDWKKIGDGRFQGGRQTMDEGEAAPDGKQEERKAHVPETAYAV